MNHPQTTRAAAQALRDAGLSYYRISRQLGIGNATVHRWLNPHYEAKSRATSRACKERYRGVCIDCGATTGSGNGNGKPLRCMSCSRAHISRNRLWTEEAIILAIQFYADKYGHPPGARDWNPAMCRRDFRDDLADRFYEDNCWPPTNTVQRMFGRWSAAIAAAGFTPNTPGHKYVDDGLRA